MWERILSGGAQSINIGILLSQLFGIPLSQNVTTKENPGLQMWLKLVIGFPLFTCIIRIILFLTIYNFDTPKYALNFSFPA